MQVHELRKERRRIMRAEGSAVVSGGNPSAIPVDEWRAHKLRGMADHHPQGAGLGRQERRSCDYRDILSASAALRSLADQPTVLTGFTSFAKHMI